MSKSYPPDWNERRKKVYQRDDYTCQNCGIIAGTDPDIQLHAHHIVPKANGGSHSTSNLIALCEDCHNAVHGNLLAPSAMADSKEESPVTVDSMQRWAEAVISNPKENQYIQSDPSMMGFDGCALCGNSESLLMLSNFSSFETVDNITICTECYSVYTLTMQGWTVEFSTFDAEDITLTGEMWSQAAEHGVSDPSDLEEYKLVSEWQSRRKKVVFGGGFFLTFFLGAGALLIINFLFSAMVAIVGSTLTAIMTQRVDGQAKQMIKEIQNES